MHLNLDLLGNEFIPATEMDPISKESFVLRSS